LHVYVVHSAATNPVLFTQKNHSMQKFPVNHVPAFKAIVRLSLFACTLGLFVSCKKGDTGPAGTANVMYSDWFTPSTYTLSTVFGMKNLDYTKAAPGITQRVLDSGLVLTYGKLTGYNTAIWPTGQVAALPILLTYSQGGTQTDTWSAYTTPGNLRINFVNNTNYYSSLATTHSFRYIIVPGGVYGGRQMDLRSMSYEQVCDYLSIPQ
jgi:hypothetical protein